MREQVKCDDAKLDERVCEQVSKACEKLKKKDGPGTLSIALYSEQPKGGIMFGTTKSKWEEWKVVVHIKIGEAFAPAAGQGSEYLCFPSACLLGKQLCID